MARFPARRMFAAIALMGALLLGSMPVAAQPSRSQAAQAELKKKAAKAKAARAKNTKTVTRAAPVLPRPTRLLFMAPLPPPRPAQLTPLAQEVQPPPLAQAAQPAPPAQEAQPSQAKPPPPPPPVGIRISPTQLNMVRTAPEQIGQVPNHFFWIRQGLQAVQDPVDGALVFITDEGRVAGRAKLPPAFLISEVFPEENQIRLIDGGRRQLILLRTLDPAALPALTETTVAADGTMQSKRLTRRSAQQLTLNDERRAGTRALDVRSLAGGTLAQAYEVGPGSGDNRYIVSEEIIGAKPTLQVRVFVQRFDRAGQLTGVVFVPLDGMDAVPRDFITVTGDGKARVLVPTDKGVKIKEIEFATPPGGKSLNAEQLKSLGRVTREIAVDSNVTGDLKTPFRKDAPALELTVATPPIRREAVLQNARAYLTVNWVMLRENFSKPGVENNCEPGRARFWRRPHHFTEEMIGTTLGPMPYRWGGDDTPDTYRLRTEWGALAGDICTCRDVTLNYCLFPDSAGVDCSGLVSRAWGIDKRGTAGLLDVADAVNSVGELKPGDAFDWPQRHVRLFMGSPPGAATAFTVLESSTRLECEGVCERTLRPSEVNGYRLIRYRGVSETGVATSGTSPPVTTANVTPPAGAGQTDAVPAATPNEAAKKRPTKKKGAIAARRR